MATVNMSTTEQIHIQFDQRLQNIGCTRHYITRLELLGRHRQKAVMSAKDAVLSCLPFIEVLCRHLNLARCDIRFAIEADSGNTIGAIIELSGSKMIEEFTLSPTIDILQRTNLI